jgi:ABC-2 type transport system ATP-binding protein
MSLGIKVSTEEEGVKVLEVKQVSKLYENKRGVHNIDFSMSRGEIVGFLGPNGAGKTTTMRMITGYLNPTKGSILVDGLSMADHPRKARRKIGYLPETPPLYPEMTVTSYLKFVASLRDVPVREQKQRIGEVIEKLGLQGRERQIIRSLSKGYKQRLGLAQAIVHKPDLLILDEPTSGLDPKQIIEIRQLIRELGENHTVLISTHILPEVNAICNRVLIINQGVIVLDEHPDRIGGTMGETFEVSLEIKGPKEDVMRELLELPDVGVVKELDRERVEAGSTLLQVTAKDRTDIREAVFYRMAERGYPILGMKKESLSLEDIFLKLTTDEKQPEEQEPAEPQEEPEVEKNA